MDEGILRIFKEKSHYSKLTDTEIIGKKIYYFDKIPSTNDLAFTVGLKNKKDEGTVFVANTQTKGKGRLGRKWYSPKGGIYCSIILKPSILIDKAGMITLMSAISVCKTLREFGLKAKVKWPNDIVIGKRKICGILTEIDVVAQKVKFLILGIGINNTVKKQNLPAGATSIYEELHRTFNNKDVLRAVLGNLDKEYLLFNAKETDKIISEFREFSSLLHKEITITVADKEKKGRVIGFESDGALVLRHSSGLIERFISADNVREN